MSNKDGQPDTSPPLLERAVPSISVPVIAAPNVTITGLITGTSGAIVGGTGFGCTRTGTGTYAISFIAHFTAVPLVICQHVKSNLMLAPIYTVTPTTSGFTVQFQTSGAGATDVDFNFFVQNIS